MTLFFIGCASASLPDPGESMKKGEEVAAPHGYTEMIKREKHNEKRTGR